MKWELDFAKYESLARQAVSEGCVLLKNDNSALPLADGTKLAVFGRMQNHYYKSGTGSGGMVNVPYNTTILEALLEEDSITVDEELRQIYLDWEEENPCERDKGFGLEMWSQEEMPVSLELATKMADKNDAALFIIARTAGEDRDNSPEEGSFALRKNELSTIENLTKAFDKVIVLLNVGNVIDMSFVTDYDPEAVMICWQGGIMGAVGTVDVLLGRTNPSGKLADTIAVSLEDYPAHKNFGDELQNIYAEDIYVGYRYFETFAKDKVLYPFGYGLSYTTFAHEYVEAKFENNLLVATFKVKNTGKVAGKAVLEVYVEAPQGKLGKASRVLAGFAKTDILEPGKDVKITFNIDMKSFASFDDTGVIGSGFVLEAGDYNLYAGFDVREASKCYTFGVAKDIVIEELATAMKPVVAYDRIKPVVDADGNISVTYEATPLKVKDAERVVLPELIYDDVNSYKLEDVKNGKITLDEFVATLSDDDLCCIVRGEGMRSEKVTPGTASAFGGVSAGLMAKGIPAGCTDDGPSGMRLDSGMKAFSLPNGTSLACTFNTKLVYDLFTMTGVEMRNNEVDVLLGPGMNIHRHPYNGRNFEYFSEDPYLTGAMAIAQLKALQSVGVDCTIKHFCGNNQETKRYSSDSVISERALREIYLKGFEMAVRGGNAHFVMTTYGRVNGMWTSNEYELTKVILRDQWGFNGMVMTDWWAAINEEGREDALGIPGSHTNFTRMVKAQNDTYMCCPDSGTNSHGDDLADNLEKGILTRAELGECAKHVLTAVMGIPAMERQLGETTEVNIINQPERWKESLTNVDAKYSVGEDGLEVSLEGISSARGDSYSFALTFAKTGSYRFDITCHATGGDNIPIPASVIIDGKPGFSITFYGAEDASTGSKEFKVDKETSVWRLYFCHDGLIVKNMKITYIG